MMRNIVAWYWQWKYEASMTGIVCVSDGNNEIVMAMKSNVVMKNNVA
jgi:hypothetical protein